MRIPDLNTSIAPSRHEPTPKWTGFRPHNEDNDSLECRIMAGLQSVSQNAQSFMGNSNMLCVLVHCRAPHDISVYHRPPPPPRSRQGTNVMAGLLLMWWVGWAHFLAISPSEPPLPPSHTGTQGGERPAGTTAYEGKSPRERQQMAIGQ